jgi:hypothetical protein
MVLPEISPTIRRTRSTAVDLTDASSDNIRRLSLKDRDESQERRPTDDFDLLFSQARHQSGLTPVSTPLSASRHNFGGEDDDVDTLGGGGAAGDGGDGLSPGVDSGIEPEIEVEFPSFNLLDREDCLCVDDLWRDEAMTTPHFVVCGLRLRPPAPSLSPFFLHIFAKIQVNPCSDCTPKILRPLFMC